LENNPLDERSVAGVRLSRAVYMHYTAQEIRDLKEVFDFFDNKRRGFDIIYFYMNKFFRFFFIRNLKPKEIVYAMRTLGVNITVEECVAYIEKESRDTL
jgi:Ca2+-binding EF-hand superfamily protein